MLWITSYICICIQQEIIGIEKFSKLTINSQIEFPDVYILVIFKDFIIKNFCLYIKNNIKWLLSQFIIVPVCPLGYIEIEEAEKIGDRLRCREGWLWKIWVLYCLFTLNSLSLAFSFVSLCQPMLPTHIQQIWLFSFWEFLPRFPYPADILTTNARLRNHSLKILHSFCVNAQKSHRKFKRLFFQTDFIFFNAQARTQYFWFLNG